LNVNHQPSYYIPSYEQRTTIAINHQPSTINYFLRIAGCDLHLLNELSGAQAERRKNDDLGERQFFKVLIDL
jgi:hypothetical protein